MLSMLIVTYVLVFGAELIGDKTFCTIGTLAMRFRVLPIFCGSTLAYMAKMLGAVLLGSAIAKLPVALVATLSVATFSTMALVIWLKRPENQTAVDRSRSGLKVAAASFAGIFFSEWGDVGQLAAATLAARYREPQVVWLGAVLAMMTKGVMAMTLGAGVQNRLPPNMVRYVTFGFCTVMAILAALRIGP